MAEPTTSQAAALGPRSLPTPPPQLDHARNRPLPSDIRGDLHIHTTASDGKSSLAEMAVAAKECGYDYLAIADHSKHATVAHGLDAKRLAADISAINLLNDKLTESGC